MNSHHLPLDISAETLTTAYILTTWLTFTGLMMFIYYYSSKHDKKDD